MQITYFNNMSKHISLYKGTLEDYVGYVAPDTMITFELEVNSSQGIFFKEWGTNTVLISTIDLQTSPVKDEKEVVSPGDDPAYIYSTGGGEP